LLSPGDQVIDLKAGSIARSAAPGSDMARLESWRSFRASASLSTIDQ